MKVNPATKIKLMIEAKVVEAAVDAIALATNVEHNMTSRVPIATTKVDLLLMNLAFRALKTSQTLVCLYSVVATWRVICC